MRNDLQALALSFALSFGLWLSPALATAYPAYFDREDGFGLLQSTADEAFAVGVLELFATQIPQAVGKVRSVSQIVREADLKSSPSHANPNFVISDWTFENPAGSGESNLENAWLVYLQPQTYKPESNVGFELPTDGTWAIVRVPVRINGTIVDYFYPAVHLGSLADGERVTFVVRHLAAVDLQEDDEGNLVLPRYGVGLIQDPGTAAPEPSALALVLLAGVGLLTVRSRERRTSP